MLRPIVASFVVSSFVVSSFIGGIGCAAPVESEEPASADDRVPRATPIALGGCGGEEIANLAAPESAHDLTVAGDRLAWIGATGFVHLLDLGTHRVDLVNDRADHLASNAVELAWASASRVTFGSSAITPEGSVDALSLDRTHLTYIERLNLDYSRVVRRDRTTLEAVSLGDGPLAPVVAVDGSHAWYGVSATSDAATGTVFRRVSLGGGEPVDYDAVPGKAVKLVANGVGATALLSTGGSLIVTMSPNEQRARTVFQSSAIRDFAAVSSDVYFTEGKTIRRSAAGRVELVLSSSCEIGAIAAASDALYFVAWDDRGGGAIHRYAVR